MLTALITVHLIESAKEINCGYCTPQNRNYILKMKKISYLLWSGLVVALLLGTGRYCTQEDSTMAFTGSQSAAQTKPIMDEHVSTGTETATFAMG